MPAHDVVPWVGLKTQRWNSFLLQSILLPASFEEMMIIRLTRRGIFFAAGPCSQHFQETRGHTFWWQVVEAFASHVFPVLTTGTDWNMITSIFQKNGLGTK